MIDTRDPAGPRGGPALAAGGSRDFTIGGLCGVPVTARAVATNVAVTNVTASGHLVIFPAGLPLPLFATINYSAGQTRSNNAILIPDASETITVRCNQGSGTVDLVIDVTGYFQ
jgi:hypothetical protein